MSVVCNLWAITDGLLTHLLVISRTTEPVEANPADEPVHGEGLKHHFRSLWRESTSSTLPKQNKKVFTLWSCRTLFWLLFNDSVSNSIIKFGNIGIVFNGSSSFLLTSFSSKTMKYVVGEV